MGTTTTKIKGKLKKAEGRVTGDKVRSAQGRIQEGLGKVGAALERGVRKVKRVIARKAVTTKVGRKAAAAKAMP
jgi:uncharacterized protein YjbJ (UPF0337 family)